MNVRINGFPKAGNHALAKALALLGVPVDVEHRPYSEGLPIDARQVFVIRDPRNIICAKLRSELQPVTPGLFLTTFRKFQDRSLVEEMADYEPWLRHKRTYVIRYENLIRNDAAMRMLAAELGIPYFDGAWETLPGITRTWMGHDHSDYRDVWDVRVRMVWEAEGGPQLLEAWGY